MHRSHAKKPKQEPLTSNCCKLSATSHNYLPYPLLIGFSDPKNSCSGRLAHIIAFICASPAK